MLDFGRELCSDPRFSAEREWLVTNGLGGYAAGTIAGVLTRRYQALLIAALQPPVGRSLLLAKVDEVVTYNGLMYPLFANRWYDGELEPEGYVHLERFRLEGTTPVWTFACADALLEKRVWMGPRANTTYIRYDLCRGSASLALHIKVIANNRDHHGRTRAADQSVHVEQMPYGLQITANGAAPFYVLSGGAKATPQQEWYTGYCLSIEDYRGLEAEDDNLYAGLFEATLQPGDSVTLVSSTKANPRLDGGLAYAERQAYEEELLERARPYLVDAPQAIEQLVLAADQFVVRRSPPGDAEGRSIIACYSWFGDWGRDTMISLPGLTLATGCPEVGARILHTFAHYVESCMFPAEYCQPGGDEAKARAITPILRVAGCKWSD